MILSVKKTNIIAYIIFFLILLYYSQGVFYPSGSIISRVTLLMLLLINFYYIFKTTLLKRKNSITIAFILFLLLHIIYYLFGEKTKFGDFGFAAETVNVLKNTIIVFSIYFTFYYLSLKEQITEKNLNVFFILILGLFIIRYFYNQYILIDDSGREEVVNNDSYNLVLIMPFLFLLNHKKILSVAIMLVIYGLVLSSLKRGAILLATINVLIFSYSLLKNSNRSLKTTLRNLLIVVIILATLTYLIILEYNSNEFFRFRIERTIEGDSSDRDIIYKTLFDDWVNNDNVFQFLFGKGIASTVEVAGNFAHNDWLELLINFGLFGTILYAVILIKILRSRNKIITKTHKYILLMIFVTWITKSLFSGAYSYDNFQFVIMLYGFIIGHNERLIANA